MALDLLVKEGTDEKSAYTVAIVRGDTFDAKDVIKAAGFRWNKPGREKCWSAFRPGTAEENAAWLDDLRVKLGLIPPPAPSETAGSAEEWTDPDNDPDLPF